MNRRNFFVTGVMNATAFLGFLFGLKRVKTTDSPQIIIPDKVLRDLQRILAQGGQITGFSYSLPADPRFVSSGQRFLVGDEERSWRLG